MAPGIFQRGGSVKNSLLFKDLDWESGMRDIAMIAEMRKIAREVLSKHKGKK